MASAGGPPNVSQENSSEYSKQHLGWNDSFNVGACLPDHCPANERVYPAIRLQSGFSASFVIPILGGGVAGGIQPLAQTVLTGIRLDVYTQAVSSNKRAVQQRVIGL